MVRDFGYEPFDVPDLELPYSIRTTSILLFKSTYRDVCVYLHLNLHTSYKVRASIYYVVRVSRNFWLGEHGGLCFGRGPERYNDNSKLCRLSHVVRSSYMY